MTARVEFFKGLLLTAAVAVLASACAPNKLVKEWSEPGRSGPGYRKIMVMAVWPEMEARRAFEDAFVRQLKEVGVDGVPSYRFIPQDDQAPRDVVVKAVEDSGAEALILIRFLGRGEQGRDYPMGPTISGGAVVVSNVHQAYAVAWTRSFAPPATSDQSVWTFEAKVFDAKSQALVWHGIAELTNPKDRRQGSADLATLVVKELAKKKIL